MSDSRAVRARKHGVTAARAACKPQGRQGIWTAMRRLARLGSFTVRDLADQTDISKGQILAYLDALVEDGAVKKGIGGRRALYSLVDDRGTTAPVLDAKGKLRDALWRSMKMLSAGGDFNHRELAVAARTPEVPVREHEAKHYVTFLAKAAYLAATSDAEGNHTLARYRLINNTGHWAPVVQRLDTVIDPNLGGKVMWHADAKL